MNLGHDKPHLTWEIDNSYFGGGGENLLLKLLRISATSLHPKRSSNPYMTFEKYIQTCKSSSPSKLIQQAFRAKD